MIFYYRKNFFSWIITKHIHSENLLCNVKCTIVEIIREYNNNIIYVHRLIDLTLMALIYCSYNV